MCRSRSGTAQRTAPHTFLPHPSSPQTRPAPCGMLGGGGDGSDPGGKEPAHRWGRTPLVLLVMALGSSSLRIQRPACPTDGEGSQQDLEFTAGPRAGQKPNRASVWFPKVDKPLKNTSMSKGKPRSRSATSRASARGVTSTSPAPPTRRLPAEAGAAIARKCHVGA
jgi:hypothetical protein